MGDSCEEQEALAEIQAPLQSVGRNASERTALQASISRYSNKSDKLHKRLPKQRILLDGYQCLGLSNTSSLSADKIQSCRMNLMPGVNTK